MNIIYDVDMSRVIEGLGDKKVLVIFCDADKPKYPMEVLLTFSLDSIASVFEFEQIVFNTPLHLDVKILNEKLSSFPLFLGLDGGSKDKVVFILDKLLSQ